MPRSTLTKKLWPSRQNIGVAVIISAVQKQVLANAFRKIVRKYSVNTFIKSAMTVCLYPITPSHAGGVGWEESHGALFCFDRKGNHNSCPKTKTKL